MTSGRGLHVYLCVARRQALHLTDDCGGMRTSASVIAIEIEKTETRNQYPETYASRSITIMLRNTSVEKIKSVAGASAQTWVVSLFLPAGNELVEMAPLGYCGR